jgi:N-acetylglucosaminyldiphosphoundecaprenol N-acetyl-beta-D-mannosaminyltransferase
MNAPNARINAPDSIKILGVAVSAVDIDVVLAVIDGWVAAKRREYVCIRDVHGIMQARQDLVFRAIHDRAGMVTPDGMPLVWVSRLRGRPEVRRVSGPDLMPALCAHSLDKGYRHYFYGGKETVAERLVDRLTGLFPGLQIAGWQCPPFRPASNEVDNETVRRINATRPDIVWVGLSSPKQEYWMAAHAGRIEAAALIGVGAAFDVHAGIKKRAPRWVQRSGLEWSYRLLSEPRRLWKRYLVMAPKFVVLIAWDELIRRVGRLSCPAR